MTRAEELEEEERTLLPIPYRKRHLAEAGTIMVKRYRLVLPGEQ